MEKYLGTLHALYHSFHHERTTPLYFVMEGKAEESKTEMAGSEGKER
jgi:hypothetical protein